MNQIYALLDPITEEVRYIGKTKLSLEKRSKQHLTEAKCIMEKTGRRKNNKRYSWIISLINKGLAPKVKLIESVEYNWEEREKYWISKFKNLVNMTAGGEGGATNTGKKFGPLSVELKNKISIRTREKMKDPEIREKCALGGKITGNANRGKPHPHSGRYGTYKKLQTAT